MIKNFLIFLLFTPKSDVYFSTYSVNKLNKIWHDIFCSAESFIFFMSQLIWAYLWNSFLIPVFFLSLIGSCCEGSGTSRTSRRRPAPAAQRPSGSRRERRARARAPPGIFLLGFRLDFNVLIKCKKIYAFWKVLLYISNRFLQICHTQIKDIFIWVSTKGDC